MIDIDEEDIARVLRNTDVKTSTGGAAFRDEVYDALAVRVLLLIREREIQTLEEA